MSYYHIYLKHLKPATGNETNKLTVGRPSLIDLSLLKSLSYSSAAFVTNSN